MASELWDRMARAAQHAAFEQGALSTGDVWWSGVLLAALTVAGEGYDPILTKVGRMEVAHAAQVLLSLAATGGDSDE